MRAILEDSNSNLVLHELAVDFFLDKETENFVRSKKDFKGVSVKSVSVHCLLSLNIKNMTSYTVCTGHGWARVL